MQTNSSRGMVCTAGTACAASGRFVTQHPQEPSLLLLFRNMFGVSHTNANSKRPMFIVCKGVLKASFFGVGLERRRDGLVFFPSHIFCSLSTVRHTFCFLQNVSLPGQSSVGQSHSSICSLPPLCSFLLKGQRGQQSSGREHKKKGLCILQALHKVGSQANASQHLAYNEKQKKYLSKILQKCLSTWLTQLCAGTIAEVEQ